MPDMSYVSLHHHSTYSYRDGYGNPIEHVTRVADLGMSAMALTEHGNVSSHVKLEKAALSLGIKPLFGCELYTGGVDEDTRSRFKWHLTVLAENAEGYRNLLRLVSKSWEEFYQWPTVSGEMLSEYSEGLVVLSGCADSKLSCDLLGGKGVPLHEADYAAARRTVRRFKALFGDRYYLEVQQFPELERTRTLNPAFAELSEECGVPLVATSDVHYPMPDDNEIQKILHASGRGTGTVAAAEASWEYDIRLTAPLSDAMIRKRLVATGLTTAQARAAIANTAEIAERCTVVLPKAQQLRFPTPGNMAAAEYCWELLRKGWRYRGFHKLSRSEQKRCADQVKYEMGMIVSKDFVDYFLMLSDLLSYAKDSGIVVGPARGSAAASLVVFLLRITEVNPMLYSTMVFERFIDVTRMDLPDVDLDFDDTKRWMIRDRLVHQYGADHVGNIGNFVKFRGKNSLDAVGRVYRIPGADTEIVKGLVIERSGGDSRYDASLEDTVSMFPQAADVFRRHPEFWNAVRLEGNMAGMSVHAAGLVVANTPITDFCGMYTRRIGKERREVQVLSVDKYDGEHLNLLKVDILGLTTMGMIGLAIEMIGMSLEELYAIPLDEPETLAAFKRLDVVGIFQFEGRATRLVCRDVSPDSFLELADINALSRPGPLFSGATAEYVETKHGRQPRMSFHPSVDRLTLKTHGQIIYQEQILQIVREVGGFPWTHAALIRKIISQKKGEAAFSEMEQRFLDGALELHGIDNELALRIWKQLVTSGSYAFCATGDTLVYRTSTNKQYGDAVSLEDLYARLHPDLLPVGTPWDGPCVACNKPATSLIRERHLYYRGVCAKCYSWRSAYQHRGLRILSMDDDCRIRPNDLLDIHSPMLRPVLKVTTESGAEIRVSKEHRFFCPTGYRTASALRVGDEVLLRGEREDTPKDERQSHNSKQTALLVAAQAAVRLRSGNTCEHCGKANDGTAHCLEFAHVLSLTDHEGNWEGYHNPANILQLCNSCHKTFDYQMTGTRKKRYSRGLRTRTDRVAAVVPDGEDWVYEVTMAGPSHNYIGNGFVNHNNVAHSISYSMIGFWCMWLKVHHPAEFYAAALQKTDKKGWPRLLRDAAKHGIAISAPDLQHSSATWSRIPDGMRLVAGFQQIDGIGEKMAELIVTCREAALLEGDPWNDWSDLLSVRGIGASKMNTIATFAAAEDPFRLELTGKVLRNIRRQIRSGKLGPLPYPTHTSNQIPPDADKLRVTFLGVPKTRNYQDYVENQRARTGEDAADIVAKMQDKDKVTSCVVHAYDAGDEDVYLRFNRYQFPKWKIALENLKIEKDVVLVSGLKRAGFGLAVHVDGFWVITPDENDYK